MIQANCEVEHRELGIGRVIKVLGSVAQVDFFGEHIDVATEELTVQKSFRPTVQDDHSAYDTKSLSFRQAFEAINLGVVPADQNQLIGLTIGGLKLEMRVKEWLEKACTDGACKVFFGFYGSGKTHNLQLIKATALRQGWVTAYLEFDPKAADPAKPHLVYRGLMSGLSFPKREDGSQTLGFYGFVKEIRDNWDKVRDGQYFQRSTWFLRALEVLQHSPHNQDEDYLAGVGWLGGQVRVVSAIRSLARYYGVPALSIPTMPQTKETSDIYVFHLVVVNEICRALGYKGLALIIDEAEHVRGFNVKRKERANNLFDVLARAAHPPIAGDTPPQTNDHAREVPPYWRHGPHFALFVGLTEGDTFNDPGLSLRDACVFLHRNEDMVRLTPPTPEEYHAWCEKFFSACYNHLGDRMSLLSSKENRSLLSARLKNSFIELPENERVLRIWIKLASLVPSILMCEKVNTLEDLLEEIRIAAKKATGYELPWD